MHKEFFWCKQEVCIAKQKKQKQQEKKSSAPCGISQIRVSKNQGTRVGGVGSAHEVLTPTPSIPLLKVCEPPGLSKFVEKSF